MQEPILNKVKSSGLVVIDLEEAIAEYTIQQIDLSEFLYQGLILREKEFRDKIKTTDWSQYAGKYVILSCSADAIVPRWAYMLLAIALQPYAIRTIFGTVEQMQLAIIFESLNKIDWPSFKDAKVVVKGCSKRHLPEMVYAEVTQRLLPYAQSIMYGEPCSTVPLYKRPRLQGEKQGE